MTDLPSHPDVAQLGSPAADSAGGPADRVVSANSDLDRPRGTHKAMFTATARVPTDRAGRYLAQLCRHAAQLGHFDRHERHGHAPAGTPIAARDERSGREGSIEFSWGCCILQATDDSLILRAEADSQERLQRIQDGIAARLERIGRRDGLAVTWQQASQDSSQGGQAVNAPALDADDAASIVNSLLTPAGRSDPFPLYAAAHALGPVSVIAEGWYLVVGYAAVNEVLRDSGFGMPGPGQQRRHATDSAGTNALRSLSRSILRTDPPDHGRMRSLISQVFTPRRIAGLQPAIEQAADRLLDDLAESAAGGASVDFMDEFAYQLPVTVICELLGVRDHDRARFRPLAADLTEALELSTNLSDTADAAAGELADYFTQLIAQRRAAPRDDLIGALVAIRDANDGRLSEQELLANLITLLVAGFETTTSLLGNGLAMLLERPGLAAGLADETVAMAEFIDEVLRHDSPVQATTRLARTDSLKIAGVPVPAGSQVLVLIGAANRDPARYRDPDHFDPTRTDSRPLSFGAGAHVCIGKALARLEGAVAFRRLLMRFPDLSAAPGEPPHRRDRLVLRGYQSLPIVLWLAGVRPRCRV
jgi:cytochrome P450